MGTVRVSVLAAIPARPERVVAALADYRGVRPAILPPQYSGYAVESGGAGTGTVASWRLRASRRRARDVVADITVSGNEVAEVDRNSSMRTVFHVVPDGGSSTVAATTTWNGAGGIGGFFERVFAPIGLRRIHAELLRNLAAHIAATPEGS